MLGKEILPSSTNQNILMQGSFQGKESAYAQIIANNV
jgi:hypothetical protein